MTLFPEVIEPFLAHGLLGKARQSGLVTTEVYPIRDFAKDPHRTVDDAPYGGGEGMVLRADVLQAACRQAQRDASEGLGEAQSIVTVYLSPQGRPLTQDLARELSEKPAVIWICGQYEGLDERFIRKTVDLEISIGDYVLTGGELPALVAADCVIRLIPGVVGNERSLTEETFEGGLLKYPQFTRPRNFEDMEIPEVLLSGDHKRIKEWRDRERIERTRLRRPDLLQKWERSPEGQENLSSSE